MGWIWLGFLDAVALGVLDVARRAASGHIPVYFGGRQWSFRICGLDVVSFEPNICHRDLNFVVLTNDELLIAFSHKTVLSIWPGIRFGRRGTRCPRPLVIRQIRYT